MSPSAWHSTVARSHGARHPREADDGMAAEVSIDTPFRRDLSRSKALGIRTSAGHLEEQGCASTQVHALHPYRMRTPAGRGFLQLPGTCCLPFVTLLAFTLFLPALWAQPIVTAPRPASTNEPDPLAAFMVAQPPIDTSSPIVATAEFEPAYVETGQSAVYRVSLNVLEQSIEWPEAIPIPPGCNLRKGASGQFLQNLGSIILPRTTFLYHLQPASNGTYVLPAYTIRARGQQIEIPAATFTAVSSGLTTLMRAPRILLESENTTCYVGQSIQMQAAFSGSAEGIVQTLAQVDITGGDLVVDHNFRAQRIEMRVTNGVSRPTFIYEALATPLRPGRTEVVASGFVVGGQIRGPLTGSGSAVTPGASPAYTLVDSEPLTLNVLPLPRDSELPGFTGGIGQFTLIPPTLSTNRVRQGDLLTLTLVLRGSGNLERVLAPEVERQPGWQVFQPRRENTLATIVRQRGFVMFEYQLIPLDDAITATPRIPFCYFNPKSRAYVDLSVAPLPIEVDPSDSTVAGKGGRSLVEKRSFLRSLIQEPKTPTELAPTLDKPGRTASRLTPTHQQGWFVGVQLIPATLIGGLWYWDRRRRFLDQHPDVLIRRRARRAIRRHARRARSAARRGDAREFLYHAIDGFREACAPNAPADPRALVCADILAGFPNQTPGDQFLRVVTTLFTAANAWRFGDVQPEDHELLALARYVDTELNLLRRTL